MDEQEYRIKAKLNEYHQKALENKALAAKKPFCREILRNDLGKAYTQRQKLKTSNMLVGGLFSVAAAASFKSLVIIPIGFYIGYAATDFTSSKLSASSNN